MPTKGKRKNKELVVSSLTKLVRSLIDLTNSSGSFYSKLTVVLEYGCIVGIAFSHWINFYLTDLSEERFELI